jgi:hypothetical protein
MANIIVAGNQYSELSVEEKSHPLDNPPLDDFLLAKMIGDRLAKLYPFQKTGCQWLVQVCHETGIVKILDKTDLSGHCYVLHIPKLGTYDDIMRKCMLAGGEMVERTLRREDCEGVRLVTLLDGVKDRHQPKVIIQPSAQSMTGVFDKVY